MHVYSEERRNIGVIDLQHKGYSMRFRQKNAIAYEGEREYVDPRDIPSVEIVFNDVREIESLIIMLDRFRKECLRADGVWNPVRLIPDDAPQREVDPFKGFLKEEIDRLFSGINKKEES